MNQPVTARTAPTHSEPGALWRWLEEQLATAEDDGYFGPQSAMWRLHREAFLGFGLGRALLLQLAHPWVAQAVADHSAYRDQPRDRLRNTIIAAELLVFGSRAQADATANRLRKQHGQIAGVLREDIGAWKAGTPYRAEDADALLWVLVTLLDTTVQVYEAGAGPLEEETVRAYLAEGARLGALLGVPPHTLPGDRAALHRYISRMIDDGVVVVGHPARQVATGLLRTQFIHGLSWRAYGAVTRAVAAATLPVPLRAQYGPILAPRHRPLYRVAGVVGRMVLPNLPKRLRLDPFAAIAIQRARRRRA
jgi:uncharacterized protein (DUF2236 family)